MVFSAIFVLNQTAIALNPPSNRCLAVSATANVTISWVKPTGPLTGFVDYTLYKDGLPIYVTTDSNSTSYTDLSANPESAPIYYYLTTHYNPGSGVTESAPSDTLKTMLLNIDNSIPNKAVLSWNRARTPSLSTSAGWYHIYKKSLLAGGSWAVIDSVPYGVESYTDDIVGCSDSVYYRIEISDNSGCTSVSTWPGEYFIDQTPPVPPVLDSVSIDPISGDVML